jgi:hypothetical protein
MTTTQNYNPLLSALRELTTPEAFRWYGTQAKATATLAQTIALKGFTTAKHWFSPSPSAIASAVAEPENAIAMPSAIAPTETIAQTIAPVVQDDGDAVVGLENAMLTLPESALEPECAPVIEGSETVEGNRSKHFPGLRIGNTPEEQLELNRPAIDLLQRWIDADNLSVTEPENAIAPALESELADGDRIAIDELEQAISSTELQQAITLSDAETNAPEPDIGEAIADDADAEMSGADEALLDDEDPTERRYWSGEDDAEALAGDET